MNNYVAIFLIIALGYLLGRVHVKGLSLGNSAVLLVALVFGHFGVLVPALVKNFGLICFVGSVGVIAGPVFIRNFKKGSMHYIAIGILTILLGTAVCVLAIKVLGFPTALSLGILNGALTSTPGLAAALEATGDAAASVGYGIAYPFGVIGVVLFVQMLPRILNTDVRAEMKELEQMVSEAEEAAPAADFKIDPSGFFIFALIVVLGVLLGNIKIPLGGGAVFSLGVSGGPLVSGLVLGHFGHVGPVSLRPPKETMEVMREFGLILFLAGAGTEAGEGFLSVLAEYGVGLFVVGAVMTLLPMVVVFWLAKRKMRLTTMNTLGSICGAMTSTPSLGALINVAGTNAVAVSYAATYPVALICVVLFSQFVAIFVK